MPMLDPSTFASAEADAVIALHCSGSTPRQWRALTERLASRCEVIAPALSARAAANWSLAEEAAPVIATVDAAPGVVHLVGHSYGGAVALEVALCRPERIASLTLYEPTAFHLLPGSGPMADVDFTEIRGIAADMAQACAAGRLAEAAERFVVYWGGRAAWDSLGPGAREAIIAYAPKACVDFESLFGNPQPVEAYRALRVPTLILSGSRTVPLSGRLARHIARTLPRGRWRKIEGADHMGPLTHAGTVADWIATHIDLVAALKAVA